MGTALARVELEHVVLLPDECDCTLRVGTHPTTEGIEQTYCQSLSPNSTPLSTGFVSADTPLPINRLFRSQKSDQFSGSVRSITHAGVIEGRVPKADRNKNDGKG
jgi:hypothetical protein